MWDVSLVAFFFLSNNHSSGFYQTATKEKKQQPRTNSTKFNIQPLYLCNKWLDINHPFFKFAHWIDPINNVLIAAVCRKFPLTHDSRISNANCRPHLPYRKNSPPPLLQRGPSREAIIISGSRTSYRRWLAKTVVCIYHFPHFKPPA